jgi:hypothetical protein
MEHLELPIVLVQRAPFSYPRIVIQDLLKEHHYIFLPSMLQEPESIFLQKCTVPVKYIQLSAHA